MPGPAPRLTVAPGQRFDRLTVVEECRVKGARGAVCRCDCGTARAVSIVHLYRGAVRSCGCYRREAGRTGAEARNESGPQNLQHGLRNHELYLTWHSMLRRCEQPIASNYHRYGGRGITVCPAWHDLSTFLADIDRLIGPRPQGKTLDRIDNDGNYEPGNVRWATQREQVHNRTRS